MKNRIAKVIVYSVLILSYQALSAAPITIDFESVASGTQLSNEYESQGVIFSGTDTLAGLVLTEGQFSTANYGNSPTQIVHAGNRGQSTTMQFIDPLNPASTIGVFSFSLLLGDGDPDTETFSVTYRDTSGAILAGPIGYTTTTDGLLIQETSTSLGARIGFVDIMLDLTSPTGVTFDDLNYNFVPIPGAVWLFGSGLLGLIGIARRKKAT